MNNINKQKLFKLVAVFLGLITSVDTCSANDNNQVVMLRVEVLREAQESIRRIHDELNVILNRVVELVIKNRNQSRLQMTDEKLVALKAFVDKVNETNDRNLEQFEVHIGLGYSISIDDATHMGFFWNANGSCARWVNMTGSCNLISGQDGPSLSCHPTSSTSAAFAIDLGVLWNQIQPQNHIQYNIINHPTSLPSILSPVYGRVLRWERV